MELESIRKEIAMQGIRRIPRKINNLNNVKEHFKTILYEMLKVRGEELQWNLVEPVVEYMIKWTYMIGDDIDFTKGILFKGDTGRGKSFLFKAWKYFLTIDDVMYLHNMEATMISPIIVNVKKISGEYQDPATGGYQVIERYGKIRSLMLDDIGKEDEFSRNYGNKINIIEEIINLREENGLLTFGTTNKETFNDLYDDRTVSRMNKLFNVVVIDHDIDFRITDKRK